MTGQNDAGRLSFCLLGKRFLRNRQKRQPFAANRGRDRKLFPRERRNVAYTPRRFDFLLEANAVNAFCKKTPFALRKGQTSLALYAGIR